MRLAFAVGLSLIAMPCAAQQSAASVPIDRGAQREVEWMAVVVRKLTSSLIDPASARVSLPYGFTPNPTTWKVWGVPMTGFFTCGTVNSRNRLGGYVGDTTFLAYVAMNGEVTTTLDSYKTPILGRVCAAGGLPTIRQTTVNAISNAGN